MPVISSQISFLKRLAFTHNSVWCPPEAPLGQNHGGKTPKNAGPVSNVAPGPPRWASTDATKIKLLNRNSLTMLESRMPGNSHVRFGGGHTEKGSNAPRWVPTLPVFSGFVCACRLASLAGLLSIARADFLGEGHS